MGVGVRDFIKNENSLECFLCRLLRLVTEIFVQNIRGLLACERKGTPCPVEPFCRVIRRPFYSSLTPPFRPSLLDTRR